MALSGNFTVFNPSPTETRMISYSVTYPSDLSESDENYELRGTTQIISESAPIQIPTTYNNQYIIIQNASLCRFEGNWACHYEWEAYDSVEDSKIVETEPNYKSVGCLEWDWDENLNAAADSYIHLSSSFISSSIINV